MLILRSCLALGFAALVSGCSDSSTSISASIANSTAPLPMSEEKVEHVVERAREVLRAMAASEAVVTGRDGAMEDTDKGGGSVSWSTYSQKFTILTVLAGVNNAKERELSYRILVESWRRARFPRPLTMGEKVVLVLDGRRRLIKIFPDTDEYGEDIRRVAKAAKDWRAINALPDK